MTEWKGFNADSELLKLARSSSPGLPYLDQILKGYIHQVYTSSYTKENKYLLLREAMDLAFTSEHKIMIINAIGRNNTLPALFHVGTFLDDEELQKQQQGLSQE